MKTDKNNVVIFDLITRNTQLNKKSKKVSDVLTRKCNKENNGIRKYDNMNARRHCSKSGLPLNWKCRKAFIETIVRKVSESSKIVISRRNNDNSYLKKELDNDKSCLKKVSKIFFLCSLRRLLKIRLIFY